MFNDSLTIDQCERLVRKLSETAFPFQCAHGRSAHWPPSDMLKFLMIRLQTFLSAFSDDWEPQNGERERPSY